MSKSVTGGGESVVDEISRLDQEIQALYQELQDTISFNNELGDRIAAKESELALADYRYAILGEKNAAELAQIEVEYDLLMENSQHEIEMETSSLRSYEVKQKRYQQIEEENEKLQQTIAYLTEKMDEDTRNHALSMHDMNKNMRILRTQMERKFRRELTGMDVSYQKEAFASLHEKQKKSMFENAKLKDEVALQGVGMANLSSRLMRQKQTYETTKQSLRRLNKKSRNLRDTLSNLAAERNSLAADMAIVGEMEAALIAKRDKALHRLENTSKFTVQDLQEQKLKCDENLVTEQKKLDMWIRRFSLFEELYAEIKPSNKSEADGHFKSGVFTIEHKVKHPFTGHSTRSHTTATLPSIAAAVDQGLNFSPPGSPELNGSSAAATAATTDTGSNHNMTATITNNNNNSEHVRFGGSSLSRQGSQSSVRSGDGGHRDIPHSAVGGGGASVTSLLSLQSASATTIVAAPARQYRLAEVEELVKKDKILSHALKTIQGKESALVHQDDDEEEEKQEKAEEGKEIEAAEEKGAKELAVSAAAGGGGSLNKQAASGGFISPRGTTAGAATGGSSTKKKLKKKKRVEEEGPPQEQNMIAWIVFKILDIWDLTQMEYEMELEEALFNLQSSAAAAAGVSGVGVVYGGSNGFDDNRHSIPEHAPYFAAASVNSGTTFGAGATAAAADGSGIEGAAAALDGTGPLLVGGGSSSSSRNNIAAAVTAEKEMEEGILVLRTFDSLSPGGLNAVRADGVSFGSGNNYDDGDGDGEEEEDKYDGWSAAERATDTKESEKEMEMEMERNIMKNSEMSEQELEEMWALVTSTVVADDNLDNQHQHHPQSLSHSHSHHHSYGSHEKMNMTTTWIKPLAAQRRLPECDYHIRSAVRPKLSAAERNKSSARFEAMVRSSNGDIGPPVVNHDVSHKNQTHAKTFTLPSIMASTAPDGKKLKICMHNPSISTTNSSTTRTPAASDSPGFRASSIPGGGGKKGDALLTPSARPVPPTRVTTDAIKDIIVHNSEKSGGKSDKVGLALSKSLRNLDLIQKLHSINAGGNSGSGEGLGAVMGGRGKAVGDRNSKSTGALLALGTVQ